MFSPDWNLLHFLLADVIMCILCYKNRFLSDRVSQLEQQLDSQKREMEREAIVKNASLQSQVYEWEFKLHNFQNDLNKKTSQIQSINSRIINVRRELESNIDALRLLMLNSSQKKTEPSVSDPVV